MRWMREAGAAAMARTRTCCADDVELHCWPERRTPDGHSQCCGVSASLNPAAVSRSHVMERTYRRMMAPHHELKQ